MILLHQLVVRNFKQLKEVSLNFPPQGTILIEGHNEAGKSSLFETVFFALYGATLIKDRDYKLEDLRSYGADVLEAQLDFSVEGRHFSIARKIGKNYTVKLICPATDGQSETITIRSEVNRRILEELRLSADALLNTCFVEQKRLERLEDLNPETRRATINELLNLRVLTQLDVEFKVTKEDRLVLQGLHERVDLARLDDALPGLEAAERDAWRCLRYAQLSAAITDWQQWQDEIETALRQQDDIREQHAIITQSLEQVAELRDKLKAIDSELSLHLRLWQDAVKSHEAAVSRVQELQNLEATLPQRQTQLKDYAELQTRLFCLEELEQQQAHLATARQQKQQQLQDYDQTLRDWQVGEQQCAAHEVSRQEQQVALTEQEAQQEAQHAMRQRVEQLARLLHHCRTHENHAGRTQEITARLEVSQRDAALLPDLRQRHSELEVAQRRLRQREETSHSLRQVEAALDTTLQQQTPTRILLTMRAEIETQRQEAETQLQMAIQQALDNFSNREIAGFAAAEKLAARRLLATLQRLTEHITDLEAALGHYGADEWEARVAQLQQEQHWLRATLEETTDVAATLQALGVAADFDSVHGALQALSHKLATSDAAVAEIERLTQQRATLEQQAQHEAEQRDTLFITLALPGGDAVSRVALATAEHANLQETLASAANTLLAKQVRRNRTTLQELERAMTRLETEQQARKTILDSHSRENLSHELKALEASIATNGVGQAPLLEVRSQLQSDDLPTRTNALQTRLALLQQEFERDEARVHELPTAQQAAQQEAAGVAARAEEWRQTWQAILATTPPAALEAALRQLAEVRAATQTALEQLDEAGLRATEAALQGQDAAAVKVITTRRHEQEGAQQRQAQLKEELGCDTQEPVGDFAARYPELEHAATSSATGWEQTWETRREAIRDNRSQRRAAAQTLGLDETPLDLGLAVRDFAQAEKQIAVKRHAGTIVANTRQSIVSRVMPLTMQNMRQLLPLLTEGRYQDADWDETNNYLSIYDSRAHAYQRKRVFSGGARDQISLALRLAFALATLPGERNVRPGWLFLDEPLSSFDRARTNALVDLLTRGMIRRHFAQIFLVSHSESFDPQQFDYRLRLESGRIVESTLPD